MLKRFFSSFVLVATVALYGCGGGGGGGGGTTLTPLTNPGIAAITVTPVTTDLSIDAASVNTQQFTATGTYTDNSTKDLTGLVTWSSSDSTIATIATGGMATAVAVGSTTITATYADFAGTTTLTVSTAQLLTPTTIAGLSGTSGTTDGTGPAARFKNPYSMTTDGTNLYVADTFNNTIRKCVISTGVVTTIAGSPGIPGSADGTGSAARFNGVFGITNDGTNLYVSDGLNSTVRKIVISTGVVTTIAGSPGVIGSLDGTGSAAQFNQPMGITTDGTNLYVSDNLNHSIRKIVISSGVVTSIPNVVDKPFAITMFGAFLYVTDTINNTISQIDISTGFVTAVFGSPGVPGFANGTGTAVKFNTPNGITTDGTNLYVADTLNGAVRKIVISTGKVTNVATQDNTLGPLGITMIGTTLYTSNFDQTIKVLQ